MSAILTEPEAPAAINRCKIEEVFARPFIELIGLAPRNPVVRGLILSQTGKLPGSERETFEQIKEWVETTCDKRLRPPNANHSEEAFAVNVEFAETEYGRAGYSVPRSGSDEFNLNTDELLDMVQKAIDDGEGMETVVDNIRELINSEAWDRCDPNLDDYGDYDYEDHESTDSGNTSVEFSTTQVRDRLQRFLRERHPELLEEIT